MATQNIPIPRSYSQILGDLLAAFLSRFGLSKLKAGSPLLSVMEAAAQSDMRSSEDIFSILNSRSLDRASSVALDQIANDEDAPRVTEAPASGAVTFTDTTFAKVSTKVFQGTAAPIAGTTSLNVADASGFPTSGSVYVGRGTQNYEGPLPYASKANAGTYWTLALSGSGTARFHNQNEGVVLAQGGNRTVQAGTICQTPQANASSAVSFTTLYAAVVPDGETQVQNVTVTCQVPGIAGNVIAGAVSVMPSPPFTGCSVTNPLPFSNGLPTEADSDLKSRIRALRRSRAKGTTLALTTAAVGVVSPGENKRVQSSTIVATAGGPATLYIDDGTGYEETSEGIAAESFMDLALGGERYFQVSVSRPVTKARVVGLIAAPFAIPAGSQLSFAVGSVATTHTFSAQDFRTPGNATAYEVATSVNNDAALGWGAHTLGGGTYVVIFAKADTNEAVQVQAVPAPGVDANLYVGFPSSRVDTMRLYRNDRLLSKDGRAATVLSRPFSAWNAMSGPQTLQLALDGTPTLTFTITDASFAGTGYAAVGQNSPAAWATVLNAIVPGQTTAVSGGQLAMTSNRGLSAAATVRIAGGTLATAAGMFTVGTAAGTAGWAVGADSDYVLDRNAGQLTLAGPLAANDKLAAGSAATRAFLQSATLPSTVAISPAGNLWFSVDAGAQIVATGVTPSTILTVAAGAVERWGYRLRLSAASGTFAAVQEGDWLVLWDAAFPAGLKGAWRAVNPTTSTVDVERPVSRMGRAFHQATKLNDGRMLLTGGFVTWQLASTTNACEVYDPTASTWTSTPTMSTDRGYHRATLLQDGRVLVTGGLNASGSIAACEIYDPAANAWTSAASLPANQERYAHAATLLADGTVLVTGGINSSNAYLATAYSYNVGLNTWTAKAPMSTGRAYHSAVLSSGNKVLAIAGQFNTTVLASTELYDPGGNSWSATVNLAGAARQSGAAVLRNDGKVMFVGGNTVRSGLAPVPSNNTDVWTEGSNSWVAGAALNNGTSYHSLVKTSDGNLVAAFGVRAGGYAETFNGAVWSIDAAPLGTFQRAGCRGVEVAANKVLYTGGYDSDTFTTLAASAEQYDEVANSWGQPDAGNLTNALLTGAGITDVRTGAQLAAVAVPAGSTYTATSLAAALAVPGASTSLYKTTSFRVATNSFKVKPYDVADPVPAGDVALVAADAQGQKVGLAASSAVVNLTGHQGSVESGNPEVGTPDFHLSYSRGSHGGASTVTVAYDGTGYLPSSGATLVAVQDAWDSSSDPARHRYGTDAGFRSFIKSQTTVSGLGQLATYDSPPAAWVPGDRLYFAHQYAVAPDDDLAVVVDGDASQKRFAMSMWRTLKPAGTTYGQQNSFKDGDNANASLAVAFGLSYDFNNCAAYMRARVLSNSSDAARSVLWRYGRLGPDGNSARVRYGLPADASLPVAVSVDNHTNQYTNVTVVLSSGALRSPITTRSTTRVGVCNPSNSNGFATACYVLGFPISSASRTANVTTLTLDLTHGGALSGITDHGFAGSESAWVQSSNGNFSSQQVTLTRVSATQVSYPDVAADQGATPNIGDLSYDVAEATQAGAGVAAGDFFRLDSSILGTAGAPPTQWVGRTIRLTGAANQGVTGLLEEWAGGGATGVVTWYNLNVAAAWKAFSNPAQSTTTLAAAVAALYAGGASAVPVFPTVIGTGAGTIDRSTAEYEGTSPTWYQLSDGVNYVQVTTAPANTSGDYQLTFKDPVAAGLATGSDWANESVRLSPQTAKNAVDWFSTPAVSGLFSAAAAAASSRARRVQLNTLTLGSAGSVQVQGGTANAVNAAVVGSAAAVGASWMVASVASASAQGLCAGQWASLANANAMPRAVTTATTTLTSIDALGNFRFDPAQQAVWTERLAAQFNCQFTVSKMGRFACYAATPFGTNPAFTSVKEGDWIRVVAPQAPTSAPQLAQVNAGLFRVVRVVASSPNESTGTFWVENPSAQDAGPSECDVRFVAFDSVVPGDQVRISTPLWGAANQGTWSVSGVGSAYSTALAGQLVRAAGTVTATTSTAHGLASGDYFTLSPGEGNFPAGQKVVASLVGPTQFTYTEAGANASSIIAENFAGADFQNHFAFRVSGSPSPVSGSFALGPSYSLVQVIEGSPSHLVKQVQSVAPDQTDPAGTTYEVKFASQPGYALASAAAGTVLQVLDKLAFPTATSQGADGYAHSTGLVGEVTKVVYGDTTNPASYPGVAASSAVVNVSGPLVQRTQIQVAVRTQTGAPRAAVKVGVQSAIAAYINQSPHGKPISISGYLGQAGLVAGVTSVTPISPALAAGSDLIQVQPSVKPRVLSLDDITVTFIGD